MSEAIRWLLADWQMCVVGVLCGFVGGAVALILGRRKSAKRRSNKGVGTPFVGFDSDMTAWLKRTGIWDGDRMVRRVVIDMEVECVTRVSIEEYADKQLLEVEPPSLVGAEVTMLEHGDSDG